MTNLIEELLKQNLITHDQLDDARARQVGAKRPLHEILVEMGFISEEALIREAARLFHMPACDLGKENVDPAILKTVPYEKAKRYGVFPLGLKDNKLVLAMSDPQDLIALEDLAAIAGVPVEPVLARRADIAAAIEKHYLVDDSIYDLMKNVVDETKIELVKDDTGDESKGFLDIETLAGEKSLVVRLCNLILSDAVKARASDIHIEPFESFVEVRYRIDGYLKSIMQVPLNMLSALVVRIKIMADLDIAETRKPQDGRCTVVMNNRKVDLRISIIPAYHGEKIVLRLLDKQKAQISLDSLGMTAEVLGAFEQMIQKPQGMILVTGPTGSGKTSTIYAALSAIKSETKNIVTIEDPVEYLISGINQIQVNPYKNVTFASGLRSILRQDPNVILVGEIRDLETAEIAFRSSLTGHLVFSTLHTNSAIATVVRLLDIGLEPYLISSSLILVVAQRLVRLICPSCRREITDGKEAEALREKHGLFIRKYGIEIFYKGVGCEACSYTGFFNRTAIFEMMKINERIRTLISQKASETLIFEAARQEGLVTLAEAGAQKVREGVVTIEEVERVCDVPELGVLLEKDKGEEVQGPQPPAGTKLEGVTQELRKAVNKRHTVLIADDEEDVRKVLSLRLKHDGYEVLEAVNGEEAVQKVFQVKPDLVIMDVMMPRMDGITATRKIRAHLETASVPVLMLTAKSDKATEIQGLDAGADDYVGKPFDHEKLLARIRMLLKRR